MANWEHEALYLLNNELAQNKETNGLSTSRLLLNTGLVIILVSAKISFVYRVVRRKYFSVASIFYDICFSV